MPSSDPPSSPEVAVAELPLEGYLEAPREGVYEYNVDDPYNSPSVSGSDSMPESRRRGPRSRVMTRMRSLDVDDELSYSSWSYSD